MENGHGEKAKNPQNQGFCQLTADEIGKSIEGNVPIMRNQAIMPLGTHSFQNTLHLRPQPLPAQQHIDGKDQPHDNIYNDIDHVRCPVCHLLCHSWQVIAQLREKFLELFHVKEVARIHSGQIGKPVHIRIFLLEQCLQIVIVAIKLHGKISDTGHELRHDNANNASQAAQQQQIDQQNGNRIARKSFPLEEPFQSCTNSANRLMQRQC